MTILIAGAGIGGLTTALSLHAAELTELLVLEASPQIAPVGVGINLPPHAARELIELGLGSELADLGVETAYLSYYDPAGQLIWAEPRGREAGYKWPQYSVHRGRLQKMLYEAVLDRLGAASVQPGCRVTAIEAGRDDVTVHCRTNDGRDTKIASTILIGADGIRSTVRQQLFPGLPDLALSGWVMWRGVTRAKPFLDGRTMVIVGDERQRVVVYPISGPDSDGHVLQNWILSRPGDDASDRGNWNKPGDPNAIANYVEGWNYDWLNIHELVLGAEVTYVYPMVDLEPMGRWTKGRVTLLGDAAHAMYPFGSNGASQAILDARILAYELAHSSEPGDALRRYEGQRREVTAKVQLANRQQASGVMTRISEMARSSQHSGAARELADTEREYKRLAGFDVSGLNERPSWTAKAINRGVY